MSRYIPFMISLALVAATTSTWANEEEIRSNCEYEIQAYGIVDENDPVRITPSVFGAHVSPPPPARSYTVRLLGFSSF